MPIVVIMDGPISGVVEHMSLRVSLVYHTARNAGGDLSTVWTMALTVVSFGANELRAVCSVIHQVADIHGVLSYLPGTH